MNPELNYKSGGCLNTGLRISVSIYLLLYLLFAVDEFLPFNETGAWNLENSILKVMFVIFIIGFSISWKYELASGIVFLFWFALMCYQAFFICSGDCDDGIVMGFPLFILGILFIVFGLKKRRSKSLQNLN